MFYQIHYSSVLRLTPFLGFIYNSLDFFEVDQIFGFPDLCVDLRIFEKSSCRSFRIFGKVYARGGGVLS